MTASEEVAGYVGRIATLTGLNVQELYDFLSMTLDQQKLTVQTYADMDWVKQPDTMAEVISLLGLVANIAALVTGLAGAATAVDALRSL